MSPKSIKIFLLLLVLPLFIISGCGGPKYKYNPERPACFNECSKVKNKCMVKAATAAAIDKCDADHGECSKPCTLIPAYTLIEPEAEKEK